MAKKVEREPSRREVKKVIAATDNHYKGEAAVNAIDLKRVLGIKKLHLMSSKRALPATWWEPTVKHKRKKNPPRRKLI